ncbi:MAG: hypothetical protein L6Q94_19400 [Calditrichia bacterium]|nr:hypothetical protein [Calditrichia bacterium]
MNGWFTPRARKRRRSASLALILSMAAVVLLSGCFSGMRTSKSPGETVFLNSFETSRDTLSWYWSGKYRLIADTPPGGGALALEVRGGGTFPAGSFISGPLRYGGYFTIECWGKVKGVAGCVQLATIADHEVVEAIRAPILEPEWKRAQSGEALYCPPGKSLMISLQPGQYGEGAMAVDVIEVKKVGKAGEAPGKIDRRITRQDLP